ncbi:zinc finger protein 513-like [Diaphorina citri]|uniref:Protein hunchback n=1 Tax=Diaphorina citri TaxID=121845 RepID=A0A3Q0IRI1_DIACI|nr:zinc finger protein 513-like [Diaphorina citri]
MQVLNLGNARNDFGTYDPRILKAHIFKHTGAKPLKCIKCSFATTYRSSLVSHMRIKHGIYNSTLFFLNISENLYSCYHCKQYEVDDIELLVEHCRTCTYMNRPHAYKYKFVCHICSYGTYDARNLKGHIFKHTGAKPLKCPKCFFTSSYERNLRSHLRRKHNHFTYS